MFTKRKIRLLEEKALEHKSWLDSMAAETEEIKLTQYAEILRIKNSKNLNWDNLFQDEESREIFFQLLLHRQFIGYHAEELRRCTFDILKLKGKAPNALDKRQYSEAIEHGVADQSMRILRDQLMKELKDDLFRFENEY
ncbi:hypothetical protein [Pelagicoccus mobilis]|uniref:Uncharacterized protein n=1 Tax=Pelagicoccus mobilis TaxID=415221 RepID=A0A934VPJ7_9BACT|nr:hypothetical protein [Pelagicoccus mobilis]MBK1875599.1 hypothetical protein [Pelagicoccus mobilis]